MLILMVILVLLWTPQLKFHDHVRTVVRKAGGLAQNFLKSTVCRSPEFVVFADHSHSPYH